MNQLSGLLYDGQKMYCSHSYEILVVDRIGAGDAFTAGIIYGLLREEPLEWIIEFAVAASCLKHTIPGDFNLVSIDEVRHVMEGKEAGRIQR